MKKSLRTIAALTAVSGLLLAGCGGKREATPAAGGDGGGQCTAAAGQMSIATGNSTGVYYVIGGGIANLISENSDMKATAAETGASVQNLQQLQSGNYDLAFSLADTAADAVEGKAAFEGSPADIKALTRIYSNYTQVIARKDSGIKKIEDFKGKTVSTGSPNSGTEVIANRLMQSAGLKDGDVQAQRIDLSKTVDGMKDGTIDAMVWSGGLPTAGVTDLFTTAGDDVEFIDISAYEPQMKEINKVYETDALPADTYPGQAEVQTIVTPNVLMVRSDMDEGTACAITKLIYDKQADLEKVHVAAGQIKLENADKTEPIEVHPGAQQAIDELRQ